jgi:hypothetical protein
MKSTWEYGAAVGISNDNVRYNVTDCFCKNLSNSGSYYPPNFRAGAINCNMKNNNDNGNFNISGNTFIAINLSKSVLLLSGSFSSLTFSYNSFYNVSSTAEGGVFKNLKIKKFKYLNILKTKKIKKLLNIFIYLFIYFFFFFF